MSVTTSQVDSYHDLHSLDRMRRRAKVDSKSALLEVARQFEAIFTNMMLKSMRDASMGDPLFDSQGQQFYQKMYDEQLTSNLAKEGSIGLADMIVRQLTPHVQDNNLENQGGKFFDVQPKSFPIKALTPEQPPQFEVPQQKPIAITQSAARVKSFVPVKPANPEITPAPNKTEQKSPSQANKISENIELDGRPETFVHSLWPYAQSAARELGVDPKLLVAQAALETGWGKAVIKKSDGQSSFNLFNIKADQRWDGERVSKQTLEFDHGIPVQERATFRAYDSFGESFKDYVNFLKTSPRYQPALANSQDSQAFITDLHQAGYATDPEYANKIKRIMADTPLNDALAQLKLSRNETLNKTGI
jgi:flagellar protein FlgJ